MMAENKPKFDIYTTKKNEKDIQAEILRTIHNDRQ